MRRCDRRRVWIVLLGVALGLGWGPGVGEAAGQGVEVSGEVFVNSEVENYLRTLQVAGLAHPHPWSVRSFSGSEVDALLSSVAARHPWSGRYDLAADSAGSTFSLLRPRVRAIYNSAFPQGENDGAVWAGRGLTTAVEAGVSYRRGRLSVTLYPVFFRAENQAFELQPTGLGGPQRFADGRTPTAIDLPQRFGDGAYQRLDPGQSSVRLELGAMEVGASTANEHWGPASRFPLLLGSNAAGFPHLFAGTASPRRIGPVLLHGRAIAGLLNQSDYAPVSGAQRRVGFGGAGVLVPVRLPGLEVGGSLFLHSPRDLDRLGLPDTLAARAANALGSLFARWVLPEAGIEIYGEFAREDDFGGARDLLLEPDHAAAYTLGLRKVWIRDPESVVSVRAELLNAQRSQLLLGRNQGQGYYRHSVVRQGHTHAGQVLGSTAATGGAGAEIAVDLVHSRGRWGVSWTRELRDERATNEVGLAEFDVLHAIAAEGVWWMREGWELTARLATGYELDRYLVDDAVNLSAQIGTRWTW